MIERLMIDSRDPASPAVEYKGAQPHVLLVVDQFPKMLGGGERALLKLAELLPQCGFRVSILTFFVHPECTALANPPCAIYVLGLQRTYDWTAVRGAFAFRKFLSTERVEIVQTFFESSDLWAGFVAKAMAGTRLVWSRRDMGILRGRKHALAYRMMAGLPDAVFAVSEQVRKHCIEVDGLDPDRVETVYNGVDLAHRASNPMPLNRADKMVVTTVGNIRRVKGHDLLVHAAAALVPRFPGLEFSVAGAVLEPEYFAELEGMVRSLGLAGRFTFLGPVADTQAHLAAADIFVLPSRSEGFSNAILEAMAAGLPVVATDVGGNAEAVQNGESGTIVPPENVDALTDAIAAILSAPERARSFGRAGKDIVQRRFSNEAMLQRVVRFYRRLLDTR
jgi:glycosyltransferase involved in cell wall biosynthesis